MNQLSNQESMEVGIALPKDEEHERLINLIESALSKLKIKLFWVEFDGNVKEISF